MAEFYNSGICTKLKYLINEILSILKYDGHYRNRTLQLIDTTADGRYRCRTLQLFVITVDWCYRIRKFLQQYLRRRWTVQVGALKLKL